MKKQYDIHELKTWPVFFQAVMNGTKTFEVRKNDRDFKIGDRLDLMEYDLDAEAYTGAHCHRFISYILDANPFIDLHGHVILGLKAVEPEIPMKSAEEILCTKMHTDKMVHHVVCIAAMEAYHAQFTTQRQVTDIREELRKFCNEIVLDGYGEIVDEYLKNKK